LILFLVAGGVILPRFYRRYPSRFSYGLLLSVVPHIVCQAHAALGSRMLFDADFNIAHVLKIVASGVPLAGLVLDYKRAYLTEATLLATQEKLRAAREVQQSLLPQRTPPLEGFDLAGTSFAAEAMGGDYFDYVPMCDGRWGIVVADVSGHDLAASVFMTQTRAYLRALAERDSDIGGILASLNRHLSEDSRHRRFVTMFLAALDPRRHTLQFAAAGHSGYLFRRNGDIESLERTCPPLGVVDETVLSCPESKLEPDDLLLIFTDGVVEATSPEGKPFGNDRALNNVAWARERTATDIVNVLHRAVLDFVGGKPLVDDMTIVVLKCLK
jgi:sigma-B regulation protein RsbU (phosphoserine phosphatase)